MPNKDELACPTARESGDDMGDVILDGLQDGLRNQVSCAHPLAHTPPTPSPLAIPNAPDRDGLANLTIKALADGQLTFALDVLRDAEVDAIMADMPRIIDEGCSLPWCEHASRTNATEPGSASDA